MKATRKRGRPPLDPTRGRMSAAERQRKHRGRWHFCDITDDILKIDECLWGVVEGRERFEREEREKFERWMQNDPGAEVVTGPYWPRRAASRSGVWSTGPWGPVESSVTETYHPRNAMELAQLCGPQSVRLLREWGAALSRNDSHWKLSHDASVAGSTPVSLTVTKVTGCLLECSACGYKWESEAIRSRCPQCATKVSILWHERTDLT